MVLDGVLGIHGGSNEVIQRVSPVLLVSPIRGRIVPARGVRREPIIDVTA